MPDESPRRLRAWQCWPYGWRGAGELVLAATRGQARARSAAQAPEAGFALSLVDIRAVRAPDHDPPEALPICPVCGDEIDAEDATWEGDTLFHVICCPPDFEDEDSPDA